MLSHNLKVCGTYLLAGVVFVLILMYGNQFLSKRNLAKEFHIDEFYFQMGRSIQHRPR